MKKKYNYGDTPYNYMQDENERLKAENEGLETINKRLKCYLDYIADFCRYYNREVGAEEHLAVLDRRVGEFLNEIRILEEPITNGEVADFTKKATKFINEIKNSNNAIGEQDIEELGKRLVDSEKYYKEFIKANGQLSTKIESMFHIRVIRFFQYIAFKFRVFYRNIYYFFIGSR